MAEQVEIQGSGSPRPLSSLGLCMWPAEQSPPRPSVGPTPPRPPLPRTSMSMSNCLCPAVLPCHVARTRTGRGTQSREISFHLYKRPPLRQGALLFAVRVSSNCSAPARNPSLNAGSRMGGNRVFGRHVLLQ